MEMMRRKVVRKQACLFFLLRRPILSRPKSSNLQLKAPHVKGAGCEKQRSTGASKQEHSFVFKNLSIQEQLTGVSGSVKFTVFSDGEDLAKRRAFRTEFVWTTKHCKIDHEFAAFCGLEH